MTQEIDPLDAAVWRDQAHMNDHRFEVIRKVSEQIGQNRIKAIAFGIIGGVTFLFNVLGGSWADTADIALTVGGIAASAAVIGASATMLFLVGKMMRNRDRLINIEPEPTINGTCEELSPGR